MCKHNQIYKIQENTIFNIFPYPKQQLAKKKRGGGGDVKISEKT